MDSSLTIILSILLTSILVVIGIYFIRKANKKEPQMNSGSHEDVETNIMWAKRMEEYEARVVRPLLEKVRAGMQETHTAIEPLFHFYLLGVYLADHEFTSQEFQNSRIKELYAKAMLDAYAIYTTLSTGFELQSSVLIRGLFESFLTAKLILEGDVNKSSKLYSDYADVEVWLHIKNQLKMANEGVIAMDVFKKRHSEEEISKAESAYLDIKHNYHPTKPYHWAYLLFTDSKGKNRNPSLLDICKKLNLTTDYYDFYGLFSKAVHSSPIMKNIMTSDGKITITPSFSELSAGYAFFTFTYLSSIIKVFANHWMEEDKYNELEFFMNLQYIELHKYYMPSEAP